MVLFQHYVSKLPTHEKVTALSLSRIMSKVVAKSWLPEGKEIRAILMSKDGGKIRKLFEDNGCDFSFYEGYSVELDVNNFEGYTNEGDRTIHVAYPPRPSDFNLSDTELRDWVNNPDPNQTNSGHPYIPVTF